MTMDVPADVTPFILEDTANRMASIIAAEIKPRPGTIFVLSMEADDFQKWGPTIDAVAGKLLGTPVFLVPRPFEIDSISEAALNAAGWFRKDESQ